MQEVTAFLVRHGPLVLFLVVLAEQLGLPLPAVPVLLAMGALAQTGHFSLGTALLIAKFVPGLSTVAPPVAGLIRMRPVRFLLWDGLGAILWAGTYLALGWIFGPQIERIMVAVSDVGSRVFVVAAAALAAYLAWKYYQRRRFLRQIDVDRVTPEELRRKIDAGESVVVVDLRHSADFEAEQDTLPGAFHMSPDAIDEQIKSIPRDSEVILFCT